MSPEPIVNPGLSSLVIAIGFLVISQQYAIAGKYGWGCGWFLFSMFNYTLYASAAGVFAR